MLCKYKQYFCNIKINLTILTFYFTLKIHRIVKNYTMKKIKLAVLFTFMSFLLQAQSIKRSNYSTENKNTTSLGLTFGGLGFTAAGFLTPSIFTNVNQKGFYTTQVTLPLYQQGPKFTCIVTGITLTITGLISLAANK